MKLASLKDGRDGSLVVVSRDLSRCLDASQLAPTMQAALDDWSKVAPQLGELQNLQAQQPTPGFRQRRHQVIDVDIYIAHARAFLVRAIAGGETYPTAWGRTRKEAEHWAAQEALLTLEEQSQA